MWFLRLAVLLVAVFSTSADARFPRGGPGWLTTFSQSLGTVSTGWNGFNLRSVIDSSRLSVSGSKVRITVQASSTGGAVVDHVFIGEQALSGNLWDFDGTQQQLFFNSGSASFTLGTSGQVTSDSLVYVIDMTKNLVVAFHFNGASQIEVQGSTAGAAIYFKSSADETSVSAPTGYTANVTTVGFVNLVEVQ